MKDSAEFSVCISKEQLNTLPTERFDGEIVVIDSSEQVAEAVEALKRASIIGFDTETKPSFQKGQINNVALIQLAAGDKCFLIRLSKLGFPEEIKDILENENLLKVGLSVKDDFHNLYKIAEFKPKGFVDLQEFVRKFHITDSSLTKIHAIVLGKRISKSQQLTNWEAPSLNPKQQQYAALDAVACVNIYKALTDGTFDPLASPYLNNISSEVEN